MLNALYFAINEIIAIKRNIYVRPEYIDSVKALNSIESRTEKVD